MELIQAVKQWLVEMLRSRSFTANFPSLIGKFVRNKRKAMTVVPTGRNTCDMFVEFVVKHIVQSFPGRVVQRLQLWALQCFSNIVGALQQ